MANKTNEKNKLKKTDKTQERYLLFKDGTRKKVIGETGKYWICKKTQYRKLSNQIAGVLETKEEAKEEEEIIPVEEIVIEEVEEQTIAEKPIEELDEGFEKIPDISDILEISDLT